MKRDEETEKTLSAAPAPRLVPGMHRQLLKAQLLTEMEKGEKKMMNVNWTRSVAWACSMVLLVTTTAWAGKKLYQVWIKKDKAGQVEIKGPDGRPLEGEAREKAIKEAEEKFGAARKFLVEKTRDGGISQKTEFTMQDGSLAQMVKEMPDVAGLPLAERITTGVKKDRKSGTVVFSTLLVKEDGQYVISTQAGGAWEESPLKELAELAEAGKGKLVETRALSGGRKVYIYEFTLAGGKKAKWGSLDRPLK